MSQLTDYVVFNDEKLAKKYRSAPIPMSVLYEAYFDGDLDIRGSLFDLLASRHLFVKYTITRQHLQWAVTNYVPEMVVHTKHQDARVVSEVYDRGNDFFEWFLGPTMVYTTGVYEHAGQSLDEAQRRQVHHVARKLQLSRGERLLDIGCGWGTLLADCAEQCGVDATGITLSQKQTDYANHMLRQRGLESTARVLCQDYRDLEAEAKFDKILCLEMIEHVGFANLGAFCEQLHELLEDDGLFLLQWTGLRRALKSEDLIWGLFMNKYVFPGADAALPPSSMLKTLEKAGFELATIDNVSGHFGTTLRAWHANWNRNRDAVLAAYGERWFRIWNFFLAWSALVAEQGNAGAYQAVLYKNAQHFNRRRWIPSVPQLVQGSGEPLQDSSPESRVVAQNDPTPLRAANARLRQR